MKCLSDNLMNIDSYLFRYKASAQKELGVDNDIHFGVMAQELEENPVTKSAVKELDDGTKVIDIKELTTINTAMLADIVRRVEEIENKLIKKGEENA